VDTPAAEIAGFAGEPVDTPPEMAAFADASPGRPRPRTANPAARRYRVTVSRRRPVAVAIRLTVQPKRPRARICCCCSWSKTLLIRARDYGPAALVNVSIAVR